MRDCITPFLTDQLLHVPMATAAAEVRHVIAESDRKDLAPLAPSPTVITIYELFSREIHECAHGMGALEGGARDIEIVLRPDATGWCRYSPIQNPIDAIVAHLVGVVGEWKIRPSSIRLYRNGCSDFAAARIWIDEYNASSAWPPLTCEAAARRAVEFVDLHWTRITALALALGNSGTLCDADVRLGCAQ
jgi:hypothetical protein